MRSSQEVYKEVAQECDSYTAVNAQNENAFTNSAKEVSCLSCQHFAADEHCELDLYDKIVAKL
ncbi:MAG: hypothetical protein IJA10_07620 [Lachnospiraceae bacterium]|nr:hypothetical protein [Lachnospiraceae bacterium]